MNTFLTYTVVTFVNSGGFFLAIPHSLQDLFPNQGSNLYPQQ